MLIGRESERRRLDALLDRARAGRSGALALRGDAGIGKTALLEYAIDRAAGMTVVRALGVESEAELEFSALLEVCWPLRRHLDEIPEHQADALRAALGLGPGEAQDRFAVGAATLSLLAASAEADPLFVVVDDAHWLDRSSQDALMFAIRRLEADRVALLSAARESEERTFDAPGIESMWLPGLPREAADDMLRTNPTVDIAPAVAERLHAAAQGNPLALLELPSLLSAEQLAGTVPLADPLPAGSSVERAFARRAAALPDSAWRALLVAAVSSSSDLEPIVAAMVALGLAPEALETVEDAGLLRLRSGTVEFRHPLVRSAVYHAAVGSERRAAHRALADVLVDPSRAEARAWHLAGAALGLDEAAAEALARAAEHARRRSGYAAAAAALERAARLSPDPSAALERLAAAADAAWRAGRTETATALVAETLASLADGRVRADALRLQGAIEFFAGNADRAAEALLEAVTLLEDSDPSGAVAAAADAVNALIRVRQPGLALETARKARSIAPPDGGETDAEAAVALGYGLCFAGRYGEAEPHLHRAVELSGASAALTDPLRAGRLSAALGWLGLHELAHDTLAETVRRARASGAVGSLPHLLASSAWQALHASRWNEAHADAGEALELADEIDQPVTATQALGVLTWLRALQGTRRSAAPMPARPTVVRARSASRCTGSWCPTASRCSTWVSVGWTTRSAGSSRSPATPRSVGSTSPASRLSSSSPRPSSAADGRATPKRYSCRSSARSLRRRRCRRRWPHAVGACLRTRIASSLTSSRPSAFTSGSRARSPSPGPACATASGCAAWGSASRRASSSGLHSRRSSGSARSHGPNERKASCERRARRCGAGSRRKERS